MANTTRIILAVSAIVIVVVIIVILVVVLTGNENVIIIKTTSGSIKGVKIESDISTFNAFFSIPYAEPPLDEFRFKTTSPVSPWEKVHDGTTEGPACIQAGSSYDVSEDCLTLSIYTNEVQGEDKPVFVWLYGGALERGSAKIGEYGPHYLMQHEQIVVTVQYRMGMLGFLNLKLEDAPGNMGLADVIEALKWVQDNIEYFGGDPNRVTLGGLSSGGIMTHALLMSPLSQGLFGQAIINSGTTLSYRFYHDNNEPITKTKEVINMIGSTDEDLLLHLKTLSPSELLEITENIKNAYPSGYAGYFPYAVTKDYFGIIPQNPIEMVQNNEYNHLPMLIGITSEEGIRLEPLMHRIDFVNENFYMVVPTDLFSVDDMSFEKNETASRIKEFYFGDKDLSRETFIEYTEMCSDSWYGHITDYLIRLQGHLNYSSEIYYYMFAVDGAYNFVKLEDNITTHGACHGDDIGYIWRHENLENVVPDPDDDFSDLARQRLVAMWSNFITTGNPTPETSSLLPVTWKPVEYPDVNYLLINRTLSMESEPFRERLRFWQQLYSWPEL